MPANDTGSGQATACHRGVARVASSSWRPARRASSRRDSWQIPLSTCSSSAPDPPACARHGCPPGSAPGSPSRRSTARRHLRDPGLHPEEAPRLCRPLSRGLRGRACLRLERAAGVLLADADREQESRDRAARGRLPDAAQDFGCPPDRGARALLDAHTSRSPAAPTPRRTSWSRPAAGRRCPRSRASSIASPRTKRWSCRTCRGACSSSGAGTWRRNSAGSSMASVRR